MSLPEVFSRAARAALLLVALLASLQAAAHTSSNASLRRIELAGPAVDAFEWQASWRDLDALLDLDTDQDGTLTWAEARSAESRLVALAQRSFEWRAGNATCEMDWHLAGSERRGDVGYARLEGQARCPGPGRVSDATYRFLEHVDATHRLLVSQPGSGPVVLEPGAHLVLAAPERDDATTPAAGSSLNQIEAENGFSAWAFLREGVGHILRGPDHVAFVLTLVLPVALVLGGADRRLATRRLLLVITAFTLAHSITLALASLHIWSPPASVVEPAIAASIAVAALHNLYSRGSHKRAAVAIAFGFGLLHGFGFAEVLAPLQLPGARLALALGLFNLGVEAGQLLIVSVALLALALLARSARASSRVHDAGSAAFASLGLFWLVQRVL